MISPALRPSLSVKLCRLSILYCNRFHSHGGVVKEKRAVVKKELSSNNKALVVLSRERKGLSLTIMESKGVTSSVLLTSGASGRVNALFSLRVLKGLLMVVNAFVLLLVAPFKGRRRGALVTVSSLDKSKDDRKVVGPVVRVPGGLVSRRNGAEDVATRRTISVSRVLMDEDVNSVRDVFMFVTSRGDTLFTQSWTPASIKVKGLVLVMHGLNEHSGRYTDFAKKLNATGLKVYGMDWIGHGGSDGLHAYVHSLDAAVSDMKAFLEKVLVENPGLPCFCFGHSTGAAIVLKAIMDPKIENLINGIVLTSPAVRVQPSHPIVALLAPIFSILLPRYQFNNANKKGPPVSRDPEALIAKYSDPLVYTGSIRVRTGYEILRITAYLLQNLRKLKVPFLVLHGTADTVTDPEGTQKLYEVASSTDKSIKLYDGYLHDLLYEPEKEAITEDIIEWFESRTSN
ncbi:hypothetical protein GIB67_005267 [Kingdonia uniflora]|uniref:Serine aminopeptidase S33 domain-containing protein n=1 Tax=Kingdonia uniflora TaxID=39325 RepID=A0A7J7NN90_9MAGN|nr:hypothetical protein GIB67_005267 [Kingdonia uniflora]